MQPFPPSRGFGPPPPPMRGPAESGSGRSFASSRIPASSGPRGIAEPRESPGMPGRGMRGAGAGPAQPGPEDWLAMLHAFADEMNAPLNLEDPLVKNILEGARTQTLASAQGQGVYGGYSQNQAERSYIGAASGLQQQRRQMGAQALQAGVGASQDLAKLRYGQARDSYQDMLANYNRENENNQGWGATIGGALGGLAGGAASFIPGLQAFAPALISGGASIGSSIGRGFGGMAPPPPAFKYTGYGSGKGV